jgi:hypothetical protein
MSCPGWPGNYLNSNSIYSNLEIKTEADKPLKFSMASSLNFEFLPAALSSFADDDLQSEAILEGFF